MPLWSIFFVSPIINTDGFYFPVSLAQVKCEKE